MIIYGRNAVRESLKADNVSKLFVLSRFQNDPLTKFALENKVIVKFVDESELTRMTRNPSHQGFAAIVGDFKTLELDELLKSITSKYPLILMLDGIEDPHNLGAIIRSVDALGVDGIIIKSRGEVQLNETVAKVSTGAINWVKVAKVNNLSRAIEKLKENGYWIVSSDGEAKQSYDSIDYKCPICLVVGSEGFGISRLVKENSDFLVKIPMYGHVNSMNASVSAAILLSQIVISRK